MKIVKWTSKKKRYRCPTCETYSDQPAICSGCGGSMVSTGGSEKVYFLEIVDLIARSDGPLPYEYRGPFNSITEADAWWQRHMTLPRYTGCDVVVRWLQPAAELEK